MNSKSKMQNLNENILEIVSKLVQLSSINICSISSKKNMMKFIQILKKKFLKDSEKKTNYRINSLTFS
jgi:hypothetical protein